MISIVCAVWAFRCLRSTIISCDVKLEHEMLTTFCTQQSAPSCSSMSFFLYLKKMENGGQLSLPPFRHELLKQHLITDSSGKYGKLPNVHKHKKSALMLFKYKMVTQVKVKSNIKKGEANCFLVKASYSSCIHDKKPDMKLMFICPRKQQRFH